MKAERRTGREALKPQSNPAKPIVKLQRPRKASKPTNVPMAIGIILACVFLAVVVIVVASTPTKSSPEPKPVNSYKFDPSAKNFTLADTEGKSHTLSNYVGMPVILDFTASWCGPCRAQAPALKKLYDEFKDKVQFLAVTGINGSQTADQAVEFKNEEGMAWPMLLDTTGDTHKLYNVTGIPRIILLDRSGVTYHEQTGNKSEGCYTDFKQAIEEIFNN